MKMKRSLVLAFAILFLLVNSALVSAITGSMGNARMILYPEVNGWTNTVIEKSIAISNVNDIALNITLVPDENATKFIEIIDKTFILQPGEEMKAQFNVKVKKEGTYQGKINVFFKPAEGTEGGVVLSSTIIVIAKKNQGYEEDNTNTDNTDNINNTSGNNTGINTGKGNNTEKPNNLIIFWGISTAVLIIILMLLLYIWNKKKGRSKRKKSRHYK